MHVQRNSQAVAYLRCSTERAHDSLANQLKSVIAKATELDVTLDASTDDLDYMRRFGPSAYKGIFVDEGFSGYDAGRPALRRLIRATLAHPGISHVLADSQDRVSRCEPQLERIKRQLRNAGVVLCS